MTRINATIPPKNLTDAHLIAEHHEIVRLPNLFLNRLKQNFVNKIGWIPQTFCLGTGHVAFFLDKGLYTHNRYNALFNECVKRSINVNNYSYLWDCYKEIGFYNNWQETTEANKLLKERIVERLTLSKLKHKFSKNIITLQQAINLLDNET
jgi:deoxyribonuclease (pyrimidine dimer)